MLQAGKRIQAFKKSNKVLTAIDTFIDSRWFLFAVAAYIYVTQAFGLDMIGFTGLVAAFVFISIFGDDTTSAVPLVCMGAFCVSIQNSPFKDASGLRVTELYKFTVVEASTFYSSAWFFIPAAILLFFILGAVTFRLIVYGNCRRAFSKKGMLIGIGVLALSFMTSGLFSKSWEWVDLAFGVMQAATFFFIYFFFASTLDFEKFTFSKIADIMLTIMFYIMALLIYIYATRFYGFMVLSGQWKNYMVSGWGTSNGFGAYLAFTMPACFYRIARTPKHKWLWIAALIFASVAIFFTLCRAAMVMAGLMLLIGTIVGIRNKEMRFRVILAILWVVTAIGALLILLGATDTFEYFFYYFIKKEEGDVSSGRFILWQKYWNYFLLDPVFGGGFAVNNTGGDMIGIYRAFAHNIVLQTLGSSGIVGLLAGLVHLIGLGKRLVKKFTSNRTFIVLSLCVFYGIALLDIAFYQAQFTFLYLVILVAVEAELYRIAEQEKRERRPQMEISANYKPRVVFPFVEAGMGHIMPERSIADAFEEKYGKYCEVVRSKFFTESNDKPLVQFEKNLCNEVKKYNKNHVYGYLNMFAMDVFGPRVLSKIIMEIYIPGIAEAAYRHMEELRPDMVVSTHWATAYYAERTVNKPINVSYVPDVQIIPLCRYPNDMTLVSTPRGYNDALKKYKKRFHKNNLRVVPFAIRKEAFNVSLDKKENRRALGLDEDKLTIVLFEGGYGLGRMKKIVELLAKTDIPITAIAICGKNEKLYEHLKTIKPEHENVTLIVEGFCEKTLEYLSAADVWLGKSGASSIAEATYFGNAAIVTKYATSMERDNAEYYLKDVKNCLKIFNAEKVVEKLKEWVENPEELHALQANALKVRDLYGSEKTADVLWELLQEKFPHLKDKK